MKKSRASLAFVLRRYHLKTNRRFRWSIYGLLAICLFALLVGVVTPQRYNLRAGQVSRALITAQTDAIDAQATSSARAAAGASVAPRYEINPGVANLALAKLDKLFNRLDALTRKAGKPRPATPPSRALLELRATAPQAVGTDTLDQMLALSPARRQLVESDSIRIVQYILDAQFSRKDMARSSLIVDQQLVGLDVDRNTRIIIGRLVESVLRPNLIYNPVATREARLQAERAVPDVWINRGDIIVRPGQIVTPAIISQLVDLKLLKTQPDYGVIGGFLFFIAMLTLGAATFIQLRKGRVARDNVHLMLYAVIVLFIAILIRLARGGVEAGLPAGIYCALPVATASMMIAMFFGTSLAMLSSVLVAVLASAAFGFSFAPFFVSLLSALAGTMAITRVSHRRVFMRAGFLTAAVNVTAIAILHFLFPSSSAGTDVWHSLVFGVVGGLLSSVLTIGILPYLETAFGVITHMGLLELANPNHPLLRQLLLEAPGTYHHSLIVGNLAEAAAEEIGADPLVCRVGAYYHDVGKMKRPAFFVENQVSGDNPHDRITPNLSYLIITAHVADGLAMLREYNMPEPIRAICAEHHGTTVLWYFYNKALEESKHQPPDADHYRYPGPRPQSKEAAIVMMCDGVEAAVRSMAKPTPQRIEALIRKILKDRLSDGQLDECDLTLRDLERMVEAFMRTLKGIYHERIEYPDPVRIGQANVK